MEKLEYSRGEWIGYKNALGTWAIATEREPIAQVERHYNAKLICACVNACIEINKENPLKVAEGLGELVEALEELSELLYGANMPYSDQKYNAKRKARQALSNMRGE